MRTINFVFNSLRVLAGLFIVLGFSYNVAALAGGTQDAAEAEPGDIVSVAAAAGTFETLLAAAESAGLLDELRSEGPLTVFAPSDEAFAALPEGTVESLLRPENRSELQAVLLYHVIPGKFMSNQLPVGTAEIATLQGAAVEITSNDAWSKFRRRVSVNGADVVLANIDASNGVIHVIDAVMMPPAAESVRAAVVEAHGESVGNS